jgi:glutaconate CoA-transferase subunit A
LVQDHIPDEQEVFIGGFAFSDPMALAHELVRQRRRGLNLLKTSGGLLVDLLLGAGVVSRLTFCHVWNSVGPQAAHAFRRAVQDGHPLKPEIEELSYGAYSAALVAGAWGLPFMPTTPMLGAGHFTTRRFRADKLAVVESPFGEAPVTVAKPICPQIGVFHVHRVDRSGNGQMFGPTAEMRYAIGACDRVFLIAEELVDDDVVRASPELTVAPSFAVDGIVIEPWSAHPTDCASYYKRDLEHHMLYGNLTKTAEGFDQYLDEWVRGVGDHAGYRARLGTLAGLSLRQDWT